MSFQSCVRISVESLYLRTFLVPGKRSKDSTAQPACYGSDSFRAFRAKRHGFLKQPLPPTTLLGGWLLLYCLPRPSSQGAFGVGLRTYD